MIDSVTFKIKDFVLYSTEYFTESQHKDLRGDFGLFGRYTTSYTNYPKQCAKEGLYFPQVSIIEQLKRSKGHLIPTSRNLLVQVSLPKLLFGTNIFDINEKLIPIVTQKLVEALAEIKVGVTTENVLNAIVTRVDFSKMIQIAPSYGTTDQILRALMPYDLKQSSDFNRRDFHNGRDGFYLKFYNSSQSLVIYDKFDEIVTNGKTNLEQEIARQYKEGKWTKGAIRFEVSLQKKQTVGGVMRQFTRTKQNDFTLQEVARSDIAKAYLLRVFESVYVKDFNRLVRLVGLKDKKLMQTINDHTDSLNTRAILYYLAHSVRDSGLKATIDDLRAQVSPATVGRYKSMIESVLGDTEATKDNVNAVTYLHRKLKAFRPVLPKRLTHILDVADTSD